MNPTYVLRLSALSFPSSAERDDCRVVEDRMLWRCRQKRPVPPHHPPKHATHRDLPGGHPEHFLDAEPLGEFLQQRGFAFGEIDPRDAWHGRVARPEVLRRACRTAEDYPGLPAH